MNLIILPGFSATEFKYVLDWMLNLPSNAALPDKDQYVAILQFSLIWDISYDQSYAITGLESLSLSSVWQLKIAHMFEIIS
ncbi:hypothetical protein QCA50_007976 [Cerrena zonata]|uniref:Uncharacterized protein n=1 Tax=Cerrena zonata TaxID=2478898 RepID=A0AAW0G554_9APHY